MREPQEPTLRKHLFELAFPSDDSSSIPPVSALEQIEVIETKAGTFAKHRLYSNLQ